MAKSLDRTITHRGIPYMTTRRHDQFPFDVPPDERYKEARVDVLDGRYNPGARIVSQPDPGETGTDKTVKVEWRFVGGNDLSKRPFITYRIWAFTVPVTSRAVLVAIENTGQLPFPSGISDDLQRAVERFVDNIAEVFAEQNARNLLTGYYQKVEILVDADCTKEKIRDKIAELSKDHVLDLAILGHGGEHPPGSGREILILHGGMEDWLNTPSNLREADVRAWKNRSDFQNLKLGLVYMMDCHGSKFSDTWLDLGFETAVGSQGDNWMPEPMFTFFWTRFRNGETVQEAARKAWEASKTMWQAIHYPECKLVHIPQPPFIDLECTDNAKIAGSRPIVSGNADLRISGEA